ncbi:uncharacterized protein LOC120685874 isoform X2 [Panicum virgatum]|uniref:uncharacterized protein LOC120685874 isoform X2 n=1 Tax=Panicum virgatum TaxID=38727 RepID=UPI0019D633C0|nr:uncharacterized protein LOC120685874 isoform X2 [Panicum virgatum]
MCPLRVILIFLSATIAGFFLIRGLNAEPDQFDADADDKTSESGSPRAPVPLHSKHIGVVLKMLHFCSSSCQHVGSAVKTGFWTMVDMASGRWLWRTLVAQTAKSESEKAR